MDGIMMAIEQYKKETGI
jgi:hypothetical protein